MTTAEATLRQLAHDYWEGVLARDPVTATYYGDHRYDDRLPDIGPAGRAAEEAALKGVLARLQEIPQDALSADDLVTWDMLRLSAEAGLDRLRLRLDEMAIDQMAGPQVWLLEMLNWHPTDSAEGLETLTARYRAFPSHIGQYIEALRDGVRDGRTAPRIAVERVLGQLRALLDTAPDASPLTQPVQQRGADRLARGVMEAVAEAVYPAYGQLYAYLAQEYLPQYAREEPGVWSVTDGAEIYGTLARQHTTTELSPEALHEIGREELGRVQDEMRAIMARFDGTTGDIRSFTERLTRDPGNLPTSREEILRDAERLLDTAQAALPRAFGRLPSTPCVVRAIEEYREQDAVAAFYYPAPDDGSRPGIFYVNTFNPSSRPRHTLPALVFHEGVPGHHLQIALAQEASDLPAFRRLSAGSLANAYVEGWALYTERLADDLGFYPDDLARFGMLGYQAWRACRLIVDTGLHHLRWSRQRAIDFFLEHVGLTELETVNEVDRYIIWPGQALSYKVGQREIERLRGEAERRLGARFDLRAFHDEMLRYGGVPLSTLRTIVTGWVERQS